MTARQKEIKESVSRHDQVINLFATARIKAIAQKAAIRKGMNLSTYIRFLIMKEHESAK